MKRISDFAKKIIILLIAGVTALCSMLFTGCNELEDYLSAYPTEGNYTLLSGSGVGKNSYIGLITDALKANGVGKLDRYSYMDYGYRYFNENLYFFVKYYEKNTGDKQDFKSIQNKKYYTGYLNCKTLKVSFLNNFECTTTYDYQDIRITAFGDFVVWFYQCKKIEFLNIHTREMHEFPLNERCEWIETVDEKICLTENGSDKTAYLYAFDSDLNHIERAFDFYGDLVFATEDYYIYELSKYRGYNVDYAAFDARTLEPIDAETAENLYNAEKERAEAMEKEKSRYECKGEEYTYEYSSEDSLGKTMLTFTRRSDGVRTVIKIDDLCERSEVLAKSVEISGQQYYFSSPQFIDGECFIVCMGEHKIGFNHPNTLVYTYDISADKLSYVGYFLAYSDLMDAYRH